MKFWEATLYRFRGWVVFRNTLTGEYAYEEGASSLVTLPSFSPFHPDVTFAGRRGNGCLDC